MRRSSNGDSRGQGIRAFLQNSKPIASRSKVLGFNGKNVSTRVENSLHKKQKTELISEVENFKESLLMKTLLAPVSKEPLAVEKLKQPSVLASDASPNASIISISIIAPGNGSLKPVDLSKKRTRPLEQSDPDIVDSHPRPPQLISSTPVSFQAPSMTTFTDPAYKKFARLVQSKSSLALPESYQKLLKIFNSLETVLSYLKSRDTPPVLHKILKSVEHQAGW
jgi:hypothetical protein